jgi:hypothetical protein
MDMDANDSLDDIKNRLKQFTKPLVDSLDAKVRDQVDARIDARVNEVLATRLAIIERAVADLDRQVRELSARLDS